MSKGGTTSAGSATEIPQWVQDAGLKQYQTGTELGQIGYTPYYGADVAAFNPMQESAFRSTGTAADAFGMGPASTVPSGATFGPHSPTWATDGIPTAHTFAGGVQGYSGMPMYTEALNTLEQQRPYQKQQLEQQFIDPATGLTPEGRKIQDINSLYNEAFGRNVGLEGVSAYLPLVQQGMTNNELRKILYDSEEAKRLGKTSQGAPIEIGVGGGLLGGAGYVPPALVSGSSGILDSISGTGSTVVDSGSTAVDSNSTAVDSNSTAVDSNSTAVDSNSAVVDSNSAVVDAAVTIVSQVTNADGTVTTTYSDGTVKTTGTSTVVDAAVTILSQVTNADGTVTTTYSDGTVETTGTPTVANDGILSTVADVASGQQMIGDTLTDTDMSTATPSTFDLYGSQIEQLMPVYQQELGRGIQDPAALAFYGDMLKNGVSIDEIRRQIAGSTEGQGFVTPAEQAAINAQNLGFGASSVSGGQADNFVPDMTAYLGDDVVFPDGEYMGSFENGFTNLLEGGGLTGAIGNAFSNLIGGSETEKVNTVSQATGMSTSEVGNLIQNMAGAAGEVAATALKLTPAGMLVQQLYPDLFKSTSNNNVDVIDKSSSTNDINTANNTYNVNNAIKYNSGLTGGGL